MRSKTARTHRLLEMAVVSTTSGFTVDEVGRVSGVSNTLLKRFGGGHGRGDCNHGSKGEEDVGELHCSKVNCGVRIG
jgi:hypothetical protein